MDNSLNDLRLAIESPFVSPDAPNYRPQSWPPHPDWPIIIDADSNVVSRWKDPIWRLDPWAGKSVTLNFGDSPVKTQGAPINPENADLLRIVTGWWLYGPNGARGYRGLKARFDQVRRLFVLCAQEGILASELNHFPRVSDRLPDIVKASRASEFLTLLHDLYEQREALGFILLDRAGLARLASAIPQHESRQTPYIPPRIWRYQVTRFRECLDEFLARREQVEECYRFCLNVYRHNLANVVSNKKPISCNPFQWPSDGTNGKKTGRRYYGPFIETAQRFGIADLLKRWVDDSGKMMRVQSLVSYLNLVSRAGLGYLLSFSLMRVEEAWNLRTDCLQVESDPLFGNIYLLSGSTTKTLSDANSIWVTSPSVDIAVTAMRIVADLRAECDQMDPGMHTIDEPGKRYLIDYGHEPWVPKKAMRNRSLRPTIPSYANAFAPFSKLFDPEQLRLSPNDLQLARLATPTLSEEFAVGTIWPLAWHQLRRTGAVNMQASGLVSDASLQYQLKHVTRAMSLYYGQNYSKVRLEEKAHTLYVRTMYETLGRELQQLSSNRFTSPHGEKRKAEIIRLISPTDAKKMIGLAKKGTAAYRPILLGVCTSRDPCPYGGIDNIAHCGGGDSSDDSKPCADVLYDSKQCNVVDVLEQILDERLAAAEADSPLWASLQAQKRSVENYRHVIRQA